MFRPSSAFDKLLEKATSNFQLEPDWPTILQICDLIRQGDCQPKYALAAIKKKLYHANPHTAMFGLLVLESCVKNCGHLIHDEIGTKQYMEQLRELVKTTNHEKVKAKVLELIQAWAYAFRNSPKYRAVQDTLNIMKSEGYTFPALKESDAMFSADTAPEWADGDVCHRCRVPFSMVQRKHHCRACGQVFCNQCSSKTSTLPKFGIEKEVRVCEACYESIYKSTSTPPPTQKTESDLPPEYLNSSLAQQNQAPPRKTEEELREEEEFQLALALSKSEAEHKEKEKKRTTSAIISSAAAVQRAKQYSPPPVADSSPSHVEDDDPELARYLNRAYWEKRQGEEVANTSGTSSGQTSPHIVQQPSAPSPRVNQKQENGETDAQIEDFVNALRSQVEIFVNRMKSNSSRGRSIANDSSVQTLFMNITAMHSQLLRYIQQQDDSRVYYEGLQDKLAQVKDARAALDALREEHREKMRRQAEEAERLRQMQMAQKLEIMRKKKQEYLQYQRQLALQRIQEQEREMQMRQEQQKQQYLMGSMPYRMPYMAGPPGMQQPYHPSGPESSPSHGQFGPGSMMPPGGQGSYPSMPPGSAGPSSYSHYSMQGLPNQVQAAQGQGIPIPMQGQTGSLPSMPRPQQGSVPPGMMGPMGPMGPGSLPPMHGMPLPGQVPVQGPPNMHSQISAPHSLPHIPQNQGPIPVQPPSMQGPLPGQPPSMQGPIPGQPPTMQGPIPGQPPSMQGPIPGQPPSMQGPIPGQPPLMQGPIPGQPHPMQGVPIPGQRPPGSGPLPPAPTPGQPGFPPAGGNTQQPPGSPQQQQDQQLQNTAELISFD